MPIFTCIVLMQLQSLEDLKTPTKPNRYHIIIIDIFC